MRLLLSRFLRIGLVAMSGIVLSGIIPISLAQLKTGGACPVILGIPACYLVTICYAAMGVSALMSRRPLDWLFILGVAPILGLAVTGTSLELLGHPTCPRSDTGWPLCYTSLIVGAGMALAYVLARRLERS